MPRVSIGMPVYNGERYLAAAIESMLAQTLGDIEVIICDNGSTDGTARICEEYAASDDRVRYYRNERNLGAAANYNRVFALSKGEYFKWAAHDDMCARTYLEKCVEVLDRRPEVVLCYTQALLVDEQGNAAGVPEVDGCDLGREDAPASRLRHYLAYERPPWHPVFGVIRRSVLAETPLIGSYIGSDLVLLARLAMSGPFHEIQERLFLRREHRQRSSRTPLVQWVRWWNPDNRTVWLYFMLCRRLVGYVAAVRTARMGWRLKRACYLEVLKWAWRERPGLMTDIYDGLYWIRRTRFPRKGEPPLDTGGPYTAGAAPE